MDFDRSIRAVGKNYDTSLFIHNAFASSLAENPHLPSVEVLVLLQPSVHKLLTTGVSE